MRVVYETTDGEIFVSQEQAKAHERKIEQNKIVAMSQGNDDVARYLNTYSGKRLLEKHDLEEEAVWEVRGEDPNCDLAGPHHCPYLFTAKGKLIDVLNKAVGVPKFWNWGAGGEIKKISIEILNMDTGENEIFE